MIYEFGMKSGTPTPNFHLKVADDNRPEQDKLQSSISVYDEDAPEILTARSQVDEAINISGALVKVYPRTDAFNDIVWEESPDPTYINHFKLKAFFKPSPLKIDLKKWGIDTQADLEIIFSHRQLYEVVGDRMLRNGDVINIPYNSASINPTHYKILNGSPTSNYRYTWLYFTCQATILKADKTVRVQDDIQTRPEVQPGGSGFVESY
jgi:hypothetical protein